MTRRTFIFLRIVIWLLPLAFLTWIAVRNVVPSGTVTVVHHQDETSDLLYGFEDEISFSAPIGKGEDARRDILARNARFFLKPWRPFSVVEFTFSFAPTASEIALFGTGGLEDPEKKVVLLQPGAEMPSDGGFLAVHAQADLTQRIAVNGSYSFALRVENAEMLPVSMGPITVTLRKPPLTFSWIVEKGKGLIRSWFSS